MSASVPAAAPDDEPIHFLDLPDELLAEAINCCSVPSLGRLLTVSKKLSALAKVPLKRALACAACKAPVAYASDILPASSAAMPEGVTNVHGIRQEHDGPARYPKLEAELSVSLRISNKQPAFGTMHCRGCSRMLGECARDVETAYFMHDHLNRRPERMPSAYTVFMQTDVAQIKNEDPSLTYLEACRLAFDRQAEKRHIYRTLVWTYLRNEAGPPEGVELICTGRVPSDDTLPEVDVLLPCNMVFGHEGAVISKQHRWDAGRGNERAIYINHLQPGSFTIDNEREETLAQGTMMVADVSCARCSRRIGWQFVKCMNSSEGRYAHHNIHHEGRFGLVRSAFRCDTAEPVNFWEDDDEDDDDDDDDDDEEGEESEEEAAAEAVPVA